jgi:hypothetical protein
MQFRLEPSVNVPAERAKLRRIRDEIAAEIEKRKADERQARHMRQVPAHQQNAQGHA